MNIFNLIAPVYEFFAFGKKKTLDHLVSMANFLPTDQVLDIGGGSGRIAKLIAPQVGQVTIIDPSAGMIKECQDKSGLICILGTAEKLPFPDKSFDKIVMVDAFHHLPDQGKALEEIDRILKPNGQIILEEYDPSTTIGWLIELMEKAFRLGSTFHTPDSLVTLLSKDNFQSKLKQVNSRYYLVANKKR